MTAILGLAIVVAVVVVLIVRLRLRRRPPQEVLHTVVDTCPRCGTVRTSIVTDPAFADQSIILGGGNVRKRTYTYPHPPAYDSAGNVCLAVGHAWPKR